MSNMELTPDNSKFIESLIVSGKSGSMDHALNMASDLLKQKAQVVDAVQLGIEQADRSDLLPADEMFDRLEKRAAQIEKYSREG